MEALVEGAASACCKSQPTGDAIYHFGRLQGRYAAMVEALRVVIEVSQTDFAGEAMDGDEDNENGVG